MTPTLDLLIDYVKKLEHENAQLKKRIKELEREKVESSYRTVQHIADQYGGENG